ncbi:hypothetical protein AB0F81_04870 [Actinoplanes sp. NPDC024001]|uniref:hypothetical protein n=1 Tax=Actinoplanes sp. NPDC024001 TaxID=3154598 RepID=UPI0033D76BA8
MGPIFTDAVVALLPHLARCPEGVLDETLAFLLALPTDPRAFAVAHSVRFLPDRLRGTAAAAALDDATAMPEASGFRGGSRTQVLQTVGPHLAGHPTVAERALTLAAALTGHRQRTVAVVALLPSLQTATPLLERALDVLLTLPAAAPNGEVLRGWALVQAVPYLSGHPHLLARAGDRGAGDGPAVALHLNIATAPTPAPAHLLSAVLALPHPQQRVVLLNDLQPRLDPAHRRTAATALEVAAAALTGAPRWQALRTLARCGVDSADRAALLFRECAAVTHIDERPSLFEAVMDGLHPRLAPHMTGLALNTALATDDNNARRRMLQRLSPQLTTDHWHPLLRALATAHRGERLGDLEAAGPIVATLDPDLPVRLTEEILRIRRWWP